MQEKSWITANQFQLANNIADLLDLINFGLV